MDLKIGRRLEAGCRSESYTYSEHSQFIQNLSSNFVMYPLFLVINIRRYNCLLYF
jgi:hypothetical protein